MSRVSDSQPKCKYIFFVSKKSNISEGLIKNIKSEIDILHNRLHDMNRISDLMKNVALINNNSYSNDEL